MATYATVAELKARLSRTDDTRDELLTQNLEAASRYIEKLAGGRVFTAADAATARTFGTHARLVGGADGVSLLVDDISSTTGLVVEVGSSSFTAVTDYETGPENALARGYPITSLLRLGGTWSVVLRPRVRVTARWGWPAVPDEIVEATLIQAARLYKRKDSPEGVLGSADWGTVRLGRVDPDVQALVQPFVLPGFA